MTFGTHPFDALMDITARPPVVFVRGEGFYLWDDTGKRYLDFVQGWAVNCLGHSPPEFAQALAQGVLFNAPRPDTLRFMPALTVTRDEISEMVDQLDAILTKAGIARKVA